MGTGDADPFDDEGGGGLFLSSSSVSCSICLELVKDNGDRSRAKLQCGHEFHLDCIGSAFNAKGVMQCPNCRKIEKGQWLYANGCRSFPDFGMEDFTHDEDLYDLSYSEMPFGVHWCPFSGFSRVHSSFEEGESPSTTYHDLLGHHAIFAEHTAAPSAAHSCPYVAYFQPLQPSSSTSNESLADGPNFNHHWNSLSGPSDISSTSHAFPAVDLHYHSWDHHSPLSPTNGRIGGADQAPLPSATMRSNRGDSDGIPRPGSFVHPFLLGHGSGPRAGSSVVSSMVPPYPGSSARTHDRIQGLHAYHQQQQPNNSPGSSGRSLQEAENPVRGRFYAWERDRFAPFPLIPVDRESSWWGPFPQAAGGSDSGSRAGGFWQRHGSERTSSQSRLESSSYQPVHPSGRMLPFL
ncbi:E3 ubiquitin-protein ligase RFI2-like isoform X2 [Telopea speciosissima]|uniref:E3 ubiquitin-protein ligase RFI2-like isoform X2 n=1 Tax=Telopea speciosissima TaxID=54955 RepID=UPI001CC41B94|nr:E3 ubiquitin-protein ligase RFI2-like isoform X2 [Telopea speciosissima]